MIIRKDIFKHGCVKTFWALQNPLTIGILLNINVDGPSIGVMT